MGIKDLEMNDEVEAYDLSYKAGVIDALDRILDFACIEEEDATAIEAALKLLRGF